MDTVQVKSNNAFFVLSEKSSRAYIELTNAAGGKDQQDKKRAEMGPLHLYVWTAWVKEMSAINAGHLTAAKDQVDKLRLEEPVNENKFQIAEAQTNELLTNEGTLNEYQD